MAEREDETEQTNQGHAFTQPSSIISDGLRGRHFNVNTRAMPSVFDGTERGTGLVEEEGYSDSNWLNVPSRVHVRLAVPAGHRPGSSRRPASLAEKSLLKMAPVSH